jgi:hypothetical protein
MLTIDKSKKWKDGQSYAEVGQPNKSKFTLSVVEGDKVFPLHQEIKCRDFLNDTLAWTDEKAKGNIWSYDFSGHVDGVPIIDQKNTTLLLTYCPLVKGNMALLNALETELGVTPTEVIDTTAGDSTIVTRGDKWWMTTTVHMAWYTQALRHLNYKLGVLTDKSDEHLINDTHDKYWKLPFGLKKLKDITIVRNAPSLQGMHDFNGFHTLLTIKQIREKLTYGKQMMAVAPELF